MRWGPTFCHILICSFCISHYLCELLSPCYDSVIQSVCLCSLCSLLISESELSSPSVSKTQTISLSHKTFQEPTSSFPGTVPLSPKCTCPHVACSGCTRDWAMRGIPRRGIHSQMISVPSDDDQTTPLGLKWRLGTKADAGTNSQTARGKLGYWTTADLLCCRWLPVGDGWDHRTRDSLLIPDFSWLKASLLASWGAVNAFLWHTTLLSKKSPPSFETAPVLSA